jgi:hypothetical protein
MPSLLEGDPRFNKAIGFLGKLLTQFYSNVLSNIPCL